MSEEKCSRRGFLKAATLAVGAGVASPLLASGNSTNKIGALLDYPTKKVASLRELKKNRQMSFNYPDENSPCQAVYINGEVKAYSILCTHKGCPTMYDEKEQTFNCPCHFSKFDAAKGGQMVIGQATEKLPEILVKVQGNDIIAYGVDGLIFGRITNEL